MTTALGDPTVDPYVWSPPNAQGYLQIDRTKSVREVYEEIVAIVGELPEGANEYFSCDCDKPWPRRARILIGTVKGSSEGDYTHVTALDTDGKWETLMLAKTFDGNEAAWRFARRLALILEVT